jgi:hypothetical protein
MTIASIAELSSLLSKPAVHGSTLQPGSPGSLNGAGASLQAPSSDGGGLSNTVVQALSQIGVTGAQSAAGSTSLKSFMQNLLAALQAQAAASGSQQAAGTSSTTLGGGGHRHGHGHGHGKGGGIGAGLQSLIQQLSASSSASSNATSTATSASTSTSPASANATTTAANAQLASLQQSFNNLMSSVGGSGSQANLSNFLTTLASDLSSGSRAGSLVSTRA